MVTCVLTLLTAFPAFAQGAPGGLQLSGSGGSAFESYRFGSPEAADIESLSLLSVPITTRVALSRRTRLDLRGGYLRAAICNSAGQETTLSGFIDTDIAASVTFGSNELAATVSGIAVIPTGNARHSADEARVAGILASDFLPLRMTTTGGGGAAGLSVNLARSLGRGSIGLGAGYLVSGEFQPLEESPSVGNFIYQPGDQLQVRLAVDRNLSASTKLTLSLSFQNHQADALDGANLYRAGNRYQGVTSIAFAAGARSSAILYAGGLRSEEGVVLQSFAHENSARTLLLVGGGLRVPLASGVFLPSADARIFRRANGIGQGYLGAVGAAFEASAGAVSIVPNIRLRLGNYIVTEGAESLVTGGEVGLTIRSRSGRR